MARIVPEETKTQIMDLYVKGVELKKISDVLGVSTAYIAKFMRPHIENGTLKARSVQFGKPKAPPGQGRGPYVKKGYNPVNKRLTTEQEQELLNDYFIKDMTYKEVMEKYNVWQNTIRIIVMKAIEQGLYKPKGQGNRKGHGRHPKKQERQKGEK